MQLQQITKILSQAQAKKRARPATTNKRVSSDSQSLRSLDTRFAPSILTATGGPSKTPKAIPTIATPIAPPRSSSSCVLLMAAIPAVRTLELPNPWAERAANIK